ITLYQAIVFAEGLSQPGFSRSRAELYARDLLHETRAAGVPSTFSTSYKTVSRAARKTPGRYLLTGFDRTLLSRMLPHTSVRGQLGVETAWRHRTDAERTATALSQLLVGVLPTRLSGAIPFERLTTMTGVKDPGRIRQALKVVPGLRREGQGTK